MQNEEYPHNSNHQPWLMIFIQYAAKIASVYSSSIYCSDQVGGGVEKGHTESLESLWIISYNHTRVYYIDLK